MRINLGSEQQQELVAHREIIKPALAELGDTPLNWAVLVECDDDELSELGVFDVFTPLESGGYACVTSTGELVIMEAVRGEQS